MTDLWHVGGTSGRILGGRAVQSPGACLTGGEHRVFPLPVIRRHHRQKRANQFRLLQAPVHQDRQIFVLHELLLSEVESERSSQTDGGMERTDAKDRSKDDSEDADWVVATGSASAKGLPVMVDGLPRQVASAALSLRLVLGGIEGSCVVSRLLWFWCRFRSGGQKRGLVILEEGWPLLRWKKETANLDGGVTPGGLRPLSCELPRRKLWLGVYPGSTWVRKGNIKFRNEC